MDERGGACHGCGAALPEEAMFCGECGRAVGPVVLPPSPVGERCDRCGATLLPDDIFCGECGQVAASITRAYSAGRDTVVIEPIAVPGRPQALRDPPPDEHPYIREDVRASLSERMKRPPEPQVVEPRADRAHVDPPRMDPRPGDDAPRSEPVRAEPRHVADSDHLEVEATRIVPPRGRGDRFVLQFSTGESVTVYGTGLIGRNPVPEPGEYFDQLVRVFDPTRSVSKTHLEFGQDGGSFWVRDRYSGNGTILREPDSSAVRCEPGKRHPVMRGGRLDLGEQFLVVS